MKKLTILFDADDTVENLSDCWIAMLNERYGTSVTPEDVHSWDISLAFPTLTKEQVFGVLYDDELWRRITPIPGSVEVLQKLYDEQVREISSAQYVMNGPPCIWLQVHRVDQVHLRILLRQSLYCPAYLDKPIAEVFPAMTCY